MVALTRRIILVSEEELEKFIRRQEKEVWEDNFPEYEKEDEDE